MQASIVIVSYNCWERLRRCLESVARHGAEVQHEVIVVDNASADDTPQKVDAEFPLGRAQSQQREPRLRGGREPGRGQGAR